MAKGVLPGLDVPANPHRNDKINYVINFWMDMCDAPFSVYLNCLWPALKEGILTYYAFDALQVFTSYVRPVGLPRAGRGGPHGPQRKKPRKRRTWIPRWGKWASYDPWEDLGRRLPFGEDARNRDVVPGVHSMWIFYGVIERVSYWMFVWELAEQFFYRWMSGVANSYYCKYQLTPWCVTTSETDANVPLLPETGMVIETVLKARHVAFVGGNGIEVVGKGSTAMLTARIIGGIEPHEFDGSQKLRLRHDSGVVVDSPAFTALNQTVVVSGQVTADGMWQAFTTGAYIWFLDNIEYSVVGMQNWIEP